MNPKSKALFSKAKKEIERDNSLQNISRVVEILCKEGWRQEYRELDNNVTLYSDYDLKRACNLYANFAASLFWKKMKEYHWKD